MFPLFSNIREAGKRAVKYLKDNPGEECIYAAGEYSPKDLGLPFSDHAPIEIGVTAREKNNEVEKRLVFRIDHEGIHSLIKSQTNLSHPNDLYSLGTDLEDEIEGAELSMHWRHNYFELPFDLEKAGKAEKGLMDGMVRLYLSLLEYRLTPELKKYENLEELMENEELKGYFSFLMKKQRKGALNKFLDSKESMEVDNSYRKKFNKKLGSDLRGVSIHPKFSRKDRVFSPRSENFEELF